MLPSFRSTASATRSSTVFAVNTKCWKAVVPPVLLILPSAWMTSLASYPGLM